MKNLFLVFLLLFLTNLISAQNFPFITKKCESCDHQGEFFHANKIKFEGGDICCNRDYKLIFHDEFDGEFLDTDKWMTCYGYLNGDCDHKDGRIHKNIGAVYLDENVKVENGVCKLITKKEQAVWYSNLRSFTSGMLMSRIPFYDFHRYEIRCKIPSGDVMWPSFWTFGWSTEIDIFEFIANGPKKPEMAVHKWFMNQQTYSWRSGAFEFNNIDFSKDFHVFAAETDKFFIRYYIDDVLVKSVSHFKVNANSSRNYDLFNCNLKPGEYHREIAFPECTQPTQLLATSGPHPNMTSNTPNEFPNSYEIDYIRVYQLNYEGRNEWYPDLCNFKIEGPKFICNNLDTVEFCLDKLLINPNLWEVTEGVQIYQNPSFYTNIKVVDNDSVTIDTIYKPNCIKVIIDSKKILKGKIKYPAPKYCEREFGKYLTIDFNVNVPEPILSSNLSPSCDQITVCVTNENSFTNIDFSYFTENSDWVSLVNNNCIILHTSSFNENEKLFVYANGYNACGNRTNVHQVDFSKCKTNPIIKRIIISPNPSAGSFLITLDDILNLSDINFIKKIDILGISKPWFHSNFNLNSDSNTYYFDSYLQNGEYLIQVTDESDNFYSAKFIIQNY